MAAPISRPRSYAFLLRIWEERSAQPPYHVLRLSLESPRSSVRRGFGSPEALARYLNDLAASAGQEAESEDDQP